MAFEMEIFVYLRELADLEFLIFAYALCLSCRGPFRRLPTHCVCLASIKALLKALILLRLWRKA